MILCRLIVGGGKRENCAFGITSRAQDLLTLLTVQKANWVEDLKSRVSSLEPMLIHVLAAYLDLSGVEVVPQTLPH